MNKKTTTKAIHTKRLAKQSESEGEALTWEVRLPRPHRRWWNTALLITGTLWVGILLVLLRNYDFAAVLVLGVTACLLTRQRQNETHSYRLQGNTLHEDGKAIDLTNFRGFELQEQPRAKRDEELPVVMLLVPKKYLSLGKPVYLPASPDDGEAIFSALPQEFAFLNDDAIDATNKALNKIMRWLRLT